MLLRNRVWNYYTSALSTRLQPQRDGTPGKRIVILTRWHPDDLAGRLMKTEDWREGRWKHISFKAITEVDTKLRVPVNQLPKDDPRYAPKLQDVPNAKRYVMGTREISLWPERFPLEDLKRRERLNPREFASLYQQSPYVLGGNLIKTQWWQRYPGDTNPQNFPIVVIGVDTAFKKTETSDYSAAIVAAIDNIGDIYILDVQRGKWEYPDLKRRLIALNNKWRGHGLRAFYVEDKASGQSIIQDLKRESGLAIVPYKVTFDKVARVNSILPLIEGGRVHLPDEAPWLDNFVEECVTFPNGTNDDQVDALSIVLDVLARTGITHQWESLDQVSGSPLTQDTYKGKSLAELASLNNSFKGYGAI
jgi:predicted phage terminase large subunit-like protein